MHKLLFFVICFVAWFPFLAYGDQTNDYTQHLNKIGPDLLDKSYQLLGGNKNDGTPFVGHCDIGCSRLIQDIKSHRFRFIRPIIYTNSATEFYKALVSDTSCRNLGVLSYVDSLDGTAGWSISDPDLGFDRPTRGFAIYKLPYPYENTLILRGEEYASSGVRAHDQNSIDVNVRASNIPITKFGATLNQTQGSFVEVSTNNCMPLTTFGLEKSIVYDKKIKEEFYDDNSWLADLIICRNKIYFLNAHIDYPIPNAGDKYTTYNIHIEAIPRKDIPPTLLFFLPKKQ